MSTIRWKGYPRAHDLVRGGGPGPLVRDPMVVYLEDVKPRLRLGNVFGRLEGFATTESFTLQGPCPLHGGTEPYFVVDPRTLRWRCHSRCHDGGDALSFLYRVNGGVGTPRGVEYFELIARVCERFKVAPHEEPLVLCLRGSQS